MVEKIAEVNRAGDDIPIVFISEELLWRLEQLSFPYFFIFSKTHSIDTDNYLRWESDELLKTIQYEIVFADIP